MGPIHPERASVPDVRPGPPPTTRLVMKGSAVRIRSAASKVCRAFVNRLRASALQRGTRRVHPSVRRRCLCPDRTGGRGRSSLVRDEDHVFAERSPRCSCVLPRRPIWPVPVSDDRTSSKRAETASLDRRNRTRERARTRRRIGLLLLVPLRGPWAGERARISGQAGLPGRTTALAGGGREDGSRAPLSVVRCTQTHLARAVAGAQTRRCAGSARVAMRH